VRSRPDHWWPRTVLMDECGSPSHQPSVPHLATAATRTQAKHPSLIIGQPVDRSACASPCLRSEGVRSTVFPATATAPRSEPLLLCVCAHNTQPSRVVSPWCGAALFGKMARVYADVNQNMPRSYWDYDSVNISKFLTG
jgi:hypothetical protein